MDALTFQQTQTSNISQNDVLDSDTDSNDVLDSDTDSYTSLEQQGKDLVKEFQASRFKLQKVNAFQQMDPVTDHRKNMRVNDDSDYEESLTPHTDPVATHGSNTRMRDTSLKIPTPGQLDTTKETSSVERSTDDMSIDTADRFQVRFVASGTTPEPFEYIPWKIQTNEGDGIHHKLHEEVTAVFGKEATTKEVFSPFHNRAYQEFNSYLDENNFCLDSLDCIARIPKERILLNDKALQFMAYFVHDFVMDYGQNCLKHMMLHQGEEEKHSPTTIRRWFSGEDNGQIEGMIKILKDDIDRNEEDKHTELCLEQTSHYTFKYNHVRKIMSDLCKGYTVDDVPFGVESIATSLLETKREDLLSIFYFVCHHYSVFGEEFNRLLKKRHWLIPQLLSERFGKMTVIQLLVYSGDCVHPKAKKASKFEEGIYVSHWFCPFVLHPMLEQKEYTRVEYQQEIGKVWNESHIRMSAHSSMIIYWHYCYFHYKDLHPYWENDDFEINTSSQSEESDTEEGSSRASKHGFCCNLKEVLDREKSENGYNRVYLTCYGDANGNELTYYGEEKLYVMEYDSHCLSILDKDGNVEDLREYRAEDLHYVDAKDIYNK